MKNPIKAIIYLWLLPHFQYRNLMRYVRFISLGETQQSQGTHTLSYQQAAILNKPVGSKIWQRKTYFKEHITAHHCFNEWIGVSVSQPSVKRCYILQTDGCRGLWCQMSSCLTFNTPIRPWLTGSGQVEMSKERNNGHRTDRAVPHNTDRRKNID